MAVINNSQFFKISAVARLTGVSIHTIRKWEERYGAVKPCRSKGGKRLYSDVDVRRLTLIKRLADQGMSLQSIATCSVDELAGFWDQLSKSSGATIGGATISGVLARAAVLGTGLAATLKHQAKALSAFEVVATADDETQLRRLLDDVEVDVLLIDCPAIVKSSSHRINDLLESLDVPVAVVVYRFGAMQYIEELRSSNVAVLRAPAEVSALERAVARLCKERTSQLRTGTSQATPNDSTGGLMPPRFSREALVTMALSNPRATCECQKNLVDVVLSLRAFEEYLCGCESRSPEDDALHRALRQKVGEARSNIEDAIEHFADVEGIALPRQ